MDLIPFHVMHAPAVDRNAERAVVRNVVADAAEARRYRLRVDFSERNAALLDLARACGDFDIQMERLAIGDYCIDGGIVVERKTYAYFATSLADRRLFPQAAGCSLVVQTGLSFCSKAPSLHRCPTFIHTH